MAKLKLTKALLKEVNKLASVGLPQKFIADGICVTEATFYNWMEKGEADKKTDKPSIYVEFFECIKKAKANRLANCLAGVLKAGQNGTWQANAWMAERLAPDDFGQRLKTHNEHSGTLGVTIVDDVKEDSKTE